MVRAAQHLDRDDAKFRRTDDTLVVDEPLYAHYLDVTGIEHPGRDEILASQPRSWPAVAEMLTGPLPNGVAVHYQKHMTHHLLPDIGRGWLGALTHAHLIRDPAYVIASYAKVRSEPTLADIGLPQQREIFRAYGGPVVDAADLLRDPAGILEVCVRRSASSGTRPCCGGRPDLVTPTVCGRRTGMRAWRRPPGSPHTIQRHRSCPTARRARRGGAAVLPGARAVPPACRRVMRSLRG